MTLDAGPVALSGAPAPLTLADFEGRVGEAFVIKTDAGTHQLTLAQAQELAHAAREGGGFRLEFTGPSNPHLPQAIYAFPIGDATHDIFIVPIGINPAGAIRYEAVFF